MPHMLLMKPNPQWRYVCKHKTSLFYFISATNLQVLELRLATSLATQYTPILTGHEVSKLKRLEIKYNNKVKKQFFRS